MVMQSLLEKVLCRNIWVGWSMACLIKLYWTRIAHVGVIRVEACTIINLYKRVNG